MLNNKATQVTALKSIIESRKEYINYIENLRAEKEAQMLTDIHFLLQEHQLKIKNHLEQHSTNVQEVLQQSANSITKVADMPQHEKQRYFTFAEMFNFSPLPKDRPPIIIKPKGKGVTFPIRKNILKNLNMQDLPKLDCQWPRHYKIIVTCNDKQDLETIKTN